MTVLCAILVTVMMGQVPFLVKGNAEGKVINSGDAKYLVDFSTYASTKPWRGDYSKVLVEKKECVVLKD